MVGWFRIQSDMFAAVIAFNEVVTWTNFVFSSDTPESELTLGLSKNLLFT